VLTRILVTTDAVGGVWRYSIELARSLSGRGLEIVLAVLGPGPDPAQRQEAAGLNVQLLVTGLPLDWLAETPDQIEHAAQVLAGMAREINADTVQLHAPALVGHVQWPVPVTAVAHSCVGTWWRAVREGPLPPDLAWRAEATASGLALADAVIAPTRAFVDALRACYATTRSIDVVLNGRTPNDRHCARQDHALTVGRLWDDAKNIITLDAAAAALEWPVLAAGSCEAPHGARLFPRNLRMLGSLEEGALAEEYARAGIFVSVALYEPFGLAVLEAAQAGCALVLSDIPTFRELWNEAAVFVPPHDSALIAAAIDAQMRNPETRSRHGEAARRRAASLTALRTADSTRRIHERLATRARAAA
jgi:glycosyltransferase involved in cell wall biosynthesis